MIPKLLQRIGILACIILVISCFMPWAWYPDIHQSFTGYYSYQNQYGKPGKFLTLVAIVALLLMYTPKVWAKRSNLFVCALGLGYAIKTYILFTSCYNTICPEKNAGIYVMLGSTLIMMLASAFPDLSIDRQKVISDKLN